MYDLGELRSTDAYGHRPIATQSYGLRDGGHQHPADGADASLMTGNRAEAYFAAALPTPYRGRVESFIALNVEELLAAHGYGETIALFRALFGQGA
ncbi:hypothetical protein [Rhizobium laguerreae]|uniref:Uncharacterized protein n=2 Tax=Rhizobium laguerreae TaxID=1076926 RepID=A0A7Y2RA76_9HYPH|nr:hypothetical protein [Rhizobium laguerreae]NNH67197.1 hypothetical protein [Rhizobium laguerreae]